MSCFTYLFFYLLEGSPSGVVANVLDYDIVVSEFKLQLCYYIHFQTNTLRNWHWIIQKGWFTLKIKKANQYIFKNPTFLSGRDNFHFYRKKFVSHEAHTEKSQFNSLYCLSLIIPSDFILSLRLLFDIKPVKYKWRR